MSDALSKRFDPRPVEAKWYSRWRERGLFGADPADPREMFSMVIPPPNVTGTLHLGHALNNTLQDVLARHQRLEGRNVLWLPGTDHAGIATQVVVEREIAKQGKTRHDLGREAFVERVWEWKAQSGARILEQLQALGASCDWSRERFTMDPGLSRAVREAFVRLYHEGLVYRGERLVNWCPRCTTVLSDLESPYQPVQGHLWTLRYPFVDGEGGVEVATTRPETMLGDTAVAVHPDDARYRDVVGRHVRLPLLGREIPVIADPFVDPEYGSGAVKVTPGHDPNDFECSRRHGLAAINLLHPDGRMNGNAGAYEGLPAAEARERVLADLEAEGALLGSEPHPHDVPHCDRCHTLVEPLLSDQWFMRMKPLAEPALAAVREGRTTFHPKSWENTFFHWLENIRDWTLSRQLWWGHRIPAWKCGACGDWTVAVEDPTHCHACGAAELRQEEDVLDTWFSSGLWPFSTLGWPDETPELARFYPTSVLSTGFDIIFFWVARMMMLGLHFMDDVPFRDVYIHPLIRDAEGKKMSKSKGNVIDPIELMSAHGTDALRFTLTRLTAQGRDIKLGEGQLAVGRTFVTKLWNAARFVLMNLDGHRPGVGHAGGLYDRWITTRLDVALAGYRRAIAEFRFNDAAQGLYQFVWGELCDWYIELAKQTLHGDDADARAATQDTLVSVLSGSLLMLHPIMPFISEEIFAALPAADDDHMLLELRFAELETRWPRLTDRLDAEEAREMALFAEIVGRVRQVRGELGLAPQTGIRVRFPTALEALVGRHEAGLRALLRAEAWLFSDEPAPATAAVVRAAGHAVVVELDDPAFLHDEVKRLAKRAKALEQDLAFVARKLGNPKFVERAKPDVVEAEREKHEALEEEAGAVADRLERLRALVA